MGLDYLNDRTMAKVTRFYEAITAVENFLPATRKEEVIIRGVLARVLNIDSDEGFDITRMTIYPPNTATGRVMCDLTFTLAEQPYRLGPRNKEIISDVFPTAKYHISAEDGTGRQEITIHSTDFLL